MAKWIACVVEGHGDVEAIPILVRRVAQTVDPPIAVNVKTAIRTPKSKLIKAGELERAVEFAARTVSGTGAVLVVLDADDDCPAVIGPALQQRAANVRANMPVAVVVAKREFETWLIAAAESIAGQAGLPLDLAAPAVPESISGAKEWLASKMEGTRNYSPTVDQSALTSIFSLELAARADSFDKCLREIKRLLSAATDID